MFHFSHYVNPLSASAALIKKPIYLLCKSTYMRATLALNGLKYANFHKKDKADKENYKPISILLTLSKVYTDLDFFSKFQFGFWGFNAQHYLITNIEKWWRSVDGEGQAGALLAALSKAFDCIDHQLLTHFRPMFHLCRNQIVGFY